MSEENSILSCTCEPLVIHRETCAIEEAKHVIVTTPDGTKFRVAREPMVSLDGSIL